MDSKSKLDIKRDPPKILKTAIKEYWSDFTVALRVLFSNSLSLPSKASGTLFPLCVTLEESDELLKVLSFSVFSFTWFRKLSVDNEEYLGHPNKIDIPINNSIISTIWEWAVIWNKSLYIVTPFPIDWK